MITVQDSRKVVFAHFWNDPNRSKFEHSTIQDPKSISILFLF